MIAGHCQYFLLLYRSPYYGPQDGYAATTRRALWDYPYGTRSYSSVHHFEIWYRTAYPIPRWHRKWPLSAIIAGHSPPLISFLWHIYRQGLQHAHRPFFCLQTLQWGIY